MDPQAFPLRKLTSFRIGGAAERLSFPVTGAEVRDELCRAADDGFPVRALGGGKNLLVDDRGVPGLVMSLVGLKQMEFCGARVVVGAGVPLATLIHRCAIRGLAGVEVLAGIPGSVGGAVRMNAGGAHGSIGDRVLLVRGFTRVGEPLRLSRDDCRFGYRTSALEGTFITDVALELRPSGADLKARAREILKRKRAAQPLAAATAGCMFKNPQESASGSAGYLLDQVKMKTRAHGGARVSPRHANFIENRGDATFSDVIALLAEGRTRVFERFGIRLSLEVEVWQKEEGKSLLPACRTV